MLKNQYISWRGRRDRAENYIRGIPRKMLLYIMAGAMLTGVLAPFLSSAGDVHAADSETLVFSGVGRYDFAQAGNNNVYRGDNGYETDSASSRLITPSEQIAGTLPSNWTTIQTNLTNAGYDVNNLSGSYLDIQGNVVGAWMANYACPNASGSGAVKMVLIGPDGSFSEVGALDDITSFIQKQHSQSGWYFLTFSGLDPQVCNQAAWSITAVYENPNYELSYLELHKTHWVIAGEGYESPDDTVEYPTEATIPFVNPLAPVGEVEIAGVFIAGGIRSWPREGFTEDKVFLAQGDTEKQLYQQSYRGKTIFANRTNTDFANGTMDVTRSHNIKGGEMDIYNETLGYGDFLANKRLSGLHAIKDGSNVLAMTVIGFRQALETPTLTVTPTIPDSDPSHPTMEIKNISTNNACGVELTLPLESIGNPTSVTIDPATGATYEVKNGNLIVKLASLAANATAKVNLTINDPDAAILNLNPTVVYYPADGGTCSANMTGNPDYRLTAYGEDRVYQIIARYVDEQEKAIADPITVYRHTGQSYETSAKEIEGYTLTAKPENETGTVDNEAIEVIYRYRTDISAPNTGGNTKGIDPVIPITISVFGLTGLAVLVWFLYLKGSNHKMKFD